MTNDLRVFYFECTEEGPFPVTEDALRRLLTPPLQAALDEKLKAGAWGAMLQFEDGCPRCKPDSAHKAVVLSLKRRIN